MKVTNVQSPHQVKQVVSNDTSAKARAVEAFKQASQPAEIPEQNTVNTTPIPVNANNISAEEMTAVTGQNRNTEDTSNPVQEQEDKPAQTTVSQDYQLLARKERQIRQQAQQQAQQLKAKEQAWANEKAQLEARLIELEKNTISRQRLKERTYDVLADEGITYDDVTQQAMDYQQKVPRYEAMISKLEQQITELKQRDQQRDTEARTVSQKQYDAAINQIRVDTRSLIKTDPNFEMIRATNSTEDVVKLIEATYKEEGRVMSVDEAAEEVEKYLEEEATKLAQTEKIKKRLSNSNASRQEAQKTQQTSQTQPSKTLTNATSGTRKLSSKERAVLAFKGELK